MTTFRTRLRVYNPVAEILEVSHPPAPRVDDLDGKRIGLYWNMKAGGDVALARAEELLKQRYPRATFAYYRGSVGWMMRHVTPADVAQVARECDVVIGTTADCGSCTSWLMRDLIEFEKAGVPSVGFVASQFISDARHSAGSFGIKDLALAVVPLPFTNQTPDEIRENVDKNIDGVVAALTKPLASTHYETKLTLLDDAWLDFDGTDALAAMEHMNDQFLSYGWGDGFPLIPPTEDRVERMLRGTRRDPEEVVAVMEPGFGKATVRKIAANAVMAGCRPDFLPVLIAAVECMAEPKINLRNKSQSTCPHAPVLWINGPIRDRIGLNSGTCALGPGALSFANTAIGRAVRLLMMNVGHTYPGISDMDTIGSPTKYSMVVAENQEKSPWKPFHVDAGFGEEESVVSLLFGCGICELQDFVNHDPERLTDVYASAAMNVANVSTGGWLLGRRSDPRSGTNEKEHHVMLICPEHAERFRAKGWSKSDLQKAMFRKARMPFETLMLQKEPEAFKESHPELQWLWESPQTLLPVVEDPECFEIVVVGGGAGRGAFLYGTGESQSKVIDE
ncbi:UGSC family (seleno)protein [Roseixanthobacter liquoris]|uniref:UGSC family (seleno)protein n=1 Tax=Roseixanthobacter liquoris TaxID=3119921 RepID=UPI003727B7A2